MSRSSAATLLALAWSSPAFCAEIHDAARNGDLEKVRMLLTDNPALVSSRDNTGMTPLHWAAREGHKDIAELLLAGKAAVDARSNTDDWTPLHEAAVFGHHDVAELLLANAADANAKDSVGKTPLHLAALEDHKDIVELLLAKHAQVNAEDNTRGGGWTPLHEAAAANAIQRSAGNATGYQDVSELLRQSGGHE